MCHLMAGAIKEIKKQLLNGYEPCREGEAFD